MSLVKAIIAELGGCTAIAAETGIPVQTIWDWGRAGNIPHWRRDAIVTMARKLDKQLAPEAAAYLASRDKAAA